MGGGELEELQYDILEAAKHVFEHEKRIIEMIFEHGEIPGLNQDDMEKFVKSRIHMCLENLGIFGGSYENDGLEAYETDDNPVADWFYKGINSTQFGDFFNGTQSEYNRNWDEGAFEF